MKNLINKKISSSITLFLSFFLIESCSSIKPFTTTQPFSGPMITSKLLRKRSFVNALPMRGYKKNYSEVATSLPPVFENFDRQPFANEAFVIANMISVVQPELDEEQRDTIASQISIAIKKYDIEPQIMVAIIDTESNFNSTKVSSTGDLSIAQINVEVWNKEFIRLKIAPMIKKQIKTDQEYAIMKMAEILSIIKKRNEKLDRRWYARYHSNTPVHKIDYLHKLEIRLNMLATSSDLKNQIAQSNNIKTIASSTPANLNNQTSQLNSFADELLTLSPMPTSVLTPQAPAHIEFISTLSSFLYKDLPLTKINL